MSSASTTTQHDFSTTAEVIGEHRQFLKTLTAQLDGDYDSLAVFECEATGELYAAVESGYKKVSVTDTGLTVDTVTTLSPTTELQPLTRIEPDAGETVHNAVDSLSFSGD